MGARSKLHFVSKGGVTMAAVGLSMTGPMSTGRSDFGASDAGSGLEESRRRDLAETALAEASSTRAQWLANWTDNELTGRALDGSLDYDAVLAILTSERLSDDADENAEGEDEAKLLADRKVAVLQRVARLREGGFYLAELSKVEMVMALALKKVSEGDVQFVEPIISLIRSVAKPFVKTSATDDTKYVRECESFVRAFGTSFDTAMPREVVLAASEAFIAVARTMFALPMGEEILSESGIVEGVTTSLRHYICRRFESGRSSHGDSVIFLLVSALEICTSKSAKLCEVVVQCGIMSCIAGYLHGQTAKEKINAGAQVVRNILDHVGHSQGQTLAITTTESCASVLELYGSESVSAFFFQTLSQILDRLVYKGFGMQDKDLRNEIALIALLLAKDASNREAIIASNLVATILCVATTPEAKRDSQVTNKTRAFASTREPEDLELKLLSWYILVELSKSDGETFYEDCKEHDIIGCLILYLEDASRSTRLQCLNRWAPYQLQQLRTEAVWVLSNLAPLLADDFVDKGGLGYTLSSLSTANSYNVLQASMHLLYALCQISDLKSKLSGMGTVGVCLQIFREFSRVENSEENALGTDAYLVQQDTASVLSLLCEENEANQKVYRECEGVEAIVQELYMLYEANASLPSSHVLSILYMVWMCVIRNEKNLSTFLSLGGFEVLLDVACHADQFICSVIFSIVADAIEKGGDKVKEIWHQWKSKGTYGQESMSATKMLLNKWREEERAKKLTNGAGVIQNLSRPLAGADMPTFQHKYKGGCHSAIDGFLDDHIEKGDYSVFPRIYAILSLLGFDNFGYVSFQDEATLAFIREYVKFKQGEIWLDISSEYEEEGLVLTDFDQIRLESGISTTYTLAVQVSQRQREILEDKHMMDTQKESSFYQSILTQQEQERQGLLYKKDRGNLTMKERSEAKLKKEAMLRNSVKNASQSRTALE